MPRNEKFKAASKAAAKKAGAKSRTTTGIDKTVVGTHVPKGANRASANRTRARHAQRTPLPPRGAKPTKTRTQSLRDAAKLDATRADGLTKAKEFASFAKSVGWWAGIKQDKEADTVLVTCKRDDGEYKETITAEWAGPRVPRGGVTLTVHGGRTILLRNVSAARKHMSGERVIKREVAPRKAAQHEQKQKVVITVNDKGGVTITHEEPTDRPVVSYTSPTYKMIVWIERKATDQDLYGLDRSALKAFIAGKTAKNRRPLKITVTKAMTDAAIRRAITGKTILSRHCRSTCIGHSRDRVVKYWEEQDPRFKVEFREPGAPWVEYGLSFPIDACDATTECPSDTHLTFCRSQRKRRPAKPAKRRAS